MLYGDSVAQFSVMCGSVTNAEINSFELCKSQALDPESKPDRAHVDA